MPISIIPNPPPHPFGPKYEPIPRPAPWSCWRRAVFLQYQPRVPRVGEQVDHVELGRRIAETNELIERGDRMVEEVKRAG